MTPAPAAVRSLRSRRRRRAAATVAGALALGGVLAACSAYEYASSAFSSPIILPCPKSWVIAEAASLVRFQPGGRRDLTDIDFEGEITGLRLGCLSDVDKKTRTGTMEVEVELLFNATRGPANRSHKAEFPYFVSVTDNNRKVLYREGFKLPVDFPGNRNRLEIRNDKIVLQLPVDPKHNSTDYVIFAGYELTREELEYNRARGLKTAK